MAETIAEMRLPTQELRDDIPFYTKTLGMKLDMIYPADDPRIGVFSGHGLRLHQFRTGAAADHHAAAGHPASLTRLWSRMCESMVHAS